MLVVQYGGVFEKHRDAAVMWNKWRLVNGKELYDVGKDPGQARDDIAEEFSDTAAKMRAHYDQWWDDLMPAAEAYPANRRWCGRRESGAA